MGRHRYLRGTTLLLVSVFLIAACKKERLSIDYALLEAPPLYGIYSAQGDGSVSLVWGDFRLCTWYCPPIITPVKHQVFISEGGPDEFRFYAELPKDRNSLTISGLENDKLYLFQVVVIGNRDSVVTTNIIMASPGHSAVNQVQQQARPYDVSQSFDGKFHAFSYTQAGMGFGLFVQEGQSPEVWVQGNSRSPAWAPADYRLAYQLRDGEGNAYTEHIMVYDVLEGNHIQITAGNHRNVGPVWSPDGQSLLFLSDREGERPADHDWWIVDVSDTTQLTRLTDVDAGNELISYSNPSASWSPDGGTIAFTTRSTHHEAGATPNRIVTMDTNGGNKQVLIESIWDDYIPVYSPHGDRIAFFSNRSGSREIWVMDLQSKTLRQITRMDDISTPTYSVRSGLYWSPDGKRLYFSGNRSSGEFGYFYFYVDVD